MKILTEKEVPLKDHNNVTWWRTGVNIPVEEAETELNKLNNSSNSDDSRCDENENVTDAGTHGDHVFVSPSDGQTGDVAGVCPRVGRLLDSHVLNRTFDLEDDADVEVVGDKSSDSLSSFSDDTTFRKTDECTGNAEAERGVEKASALSRYDLGYFVGKLSDVYKDAGKRLQDTRDVIWNAGVDEVKVAISRCLTLVSKELPLIHGVQQNTHQESLGQNSKDLANNTPQSPDRSVFMDVSRWPEGSVSSSRGQDCCSPAVFHQRLVEMPPVLAELQTCSFSELQERLASVCPQIQGSKCLGIFWIRTANRGQPNPKPGCLLILEKDITVVSAGPVGTLTVSHHFNLSEIKTVQVGLAGQHLRLIGCSEDAVLAVFTHSTKLSQDFCKVLLEAVAPGKFSEDTEGQQLLCDDLMVLSLTWSSVLPDVVLDNSGLRLTSRFKRVLADLLYIVHGNMDALDRPSLADVRPLLYTSVRVVNLRRPQQDNICQFLLTDTHVVLLLEDGVFHPVPRGSTLNPVRPHFRVLQLRKRSNSRCLFVRQKDGCVVVDIRFPAFKRPSEQQQAAPGPTAAEEPVTCHGSRRWDSWKLCFGCTADAVTVVNQLSS